MQNGSVDVTIWAVSMVRDEDDVIVGTIRHLFKEGVDHVLVADNLSRDQTRVRLEELAAEFPVTIVDDRDPAYRQSEKMTALARVAGERGATWIVPFDADERWRGTRGRTMREVLVQSHESVLAADVYDHYPRPTWRRGEMEARMPWNKGGGWSKVAFRWVDGAVILPGNHNVTGVGEPVHGELIIDHYPWRSWPQYERKMRQGASAVAAAGDAMPAHMAGLWRTLGAASGARLRTSWWTRRLEPKLRRVDRAVWRR